MATAEGQRSQKLSSLARAALKTVAAKGEPVTYRDLAATLELSPPNTIRQVTDALEYLMHEDAAEGVPFIAALVIGRARNGLPGPGFFETARALGRFDGNLENDAAAYHAKVLAEAVRYWGTNGA